MKISLITLNIVGEMFFKFQKNQDFAGFLKEYDEMLDMVKECGYSTVDVTAMETMAFTADGVRKKLDEHGLKAGCYIYMDQLASMDETGYMDRVQRGKEAVDATIVLGTDLLMLAPLAQEGIESYAAEQVHDSLAHHFIPIVEYAKEKGVRVVVEDTPDLRLHFCSMDDLKAVFEKVPGLEMAYDSGNMILVKEDPIAYYEAFLEKICHIHLKDMRMAEPKEMVGDRAVDGNLITVAPTGTGIIDLEGVVKNIKRHQYSGYLAIEFAKDTKEDYRRTLVQSREYIEKLIII